MLCLLCSHEEIHGLHELFKSFDRNGDGHITLDELREGLARQGKLGDDEVEQVGGRGGWDWVAGF
jgi:Ca2+-binding EF-hand superfamily protein